MLDERVAKALSEPCNSAEAQAVLEAAEAEFRTLEAKADALDGEALSPLLSLPEAVAKRAAASDLRFQSDRLDASVSALRARVSELRQSEAKAERDAARDAAIEERDELAGEIAERYPVIVRELTSLAMRIEASDQRCKAVGIHESAEAIGRSVPAGFHIPGKGNVPRIANINLPMPEDTRLAWGRETIVGPVIYRGADA
jgi:hypothetical protein